MRESPWLSRDGKLAMLSMLWSLRLLMIWALGVDRSATDESILSLPSAFFGLGLPRPGVALI
jgi:hypothetical protein